MKMNKKVAALVAGVMMFGAIGSASAAGIGYVNSAALMQAHPKMEKAQLDLRNAAQKAEETFKKRAEGKSDAEKQSVLQELQRELAVKQRAVIQPIQQDIIRAIQQVRKEKNLDVILESGAVIDGGSDVTAAVGTKLAK